MPLSLFAGYGVELEYMIVDDQTLDVRPVADRLFELETGVITGDVARGELCWSNELTAHLVEIKVAQPAPSLEALPELFQAEVERINLRLRTLGCRLLPGAMHPWMNPDTETELWKHEYSAVYEAYNRIFDCRGHGWANLQATHLNLPFATDEEFGRLHAAIRVLLPLLPALSASSPVMDGAPTGVLDNRLDVYRKNSRRIPSLAGDVIPEPAFSRRDYDRMIFDRIFADIAPYDSEGILRDEFLNSRGAIARFSRGAIEIRVLDIQECPESDLAILALISATLRALTEERWSSLDDLKAWPTEVLKATLLETIVRADDAIVGSRDYLAQFGLPPQALRAGDVWRLIAESLWATGTLSERWRGPLSILFEQGPLARRILRALGEQPGRDALRRVYGELADSLATGRMFVAR